VTAFDETCYDCLRRRVASGGAEPADAPAGRRSAVRYAGALAGRRVIQLLAGDPVADTVVEVPGAERTSSRFPAVTAAPTRATRCPASIRSDRYRTRSTARSGRSIPELVCSRRWANRSRSPCRTTSRGSPTRRPSPDARAAEFGGGVDAGWDAAFMKALGEG